MNKKPILIKFISIMLFLVPLLRVILICIESEFPLGEVFNKAMGVSGLDFFNFWILYPLCGLFLLIVRPWSYSAFITLQIYTFIHNITYESYSWPHLNSSPPMIFFILQFLNFLVILFFALPELRLPYFDERLRWWEKASRYIINGPCHIKNSFKTDTSSQLLDISLTGAKLSSKLDLKINDEFTLLFNLLGQDLEMSAKVVRIISKDNNTYGIKFKKKLDANYLRYKLLFYLSSIQRNYPLYRA